MNIKCLKLVTGEDIVSEVEDNVDSVTLKNPVQVSMVPSRNTGQPTFGFIPFPIASKDKELTISKVHIIFECNPAEDFETQYNSLFGSGIITPPKDIILN